MQPSGYGGRLSSALLLAAALIVLPLALVPRADAFVYWMTNPLHLPNPERTTIGRANLDGSGAGQSFITTRSSELGPGALAVDGQHVYWTNSDFGAAAFGRPPNLASAIGRANLDGSGVDPRFITGAIELTGVAVGAAHIHWFNGADAIGRANLDGSGVDQSFIADVGGYGGDLAVNFSLGKLKKDKKMGTATLTVEVPAPGGVALAQTKKLKGAEVRAEAAGEVQLTIKPQGSAKETLAEKG